MKSEELMSEMMLAKSVLEEKNELLDEREREIRGLRTRLAEAERALAGSWNASQAARRVVEEVVRIAADYADAEPHNALAARLMTHFQQNYEVEIIETTDEKIDPSVHRIIEVDRTPGSASAVQTLRRGYRIEGRTIRPALLRVVVGDDGLPAIGRAPAAT